ncbi:hypothetical protein [Micromonospora sp. NPDC023956]|uniref:hypothetical protein n=1 Tax=Micromonospora sp. NPDC023956 TaxID=3155722 RepID=UPI0034027943
MYRRTRPVALGTWHEDGGTCESDAWGPYDGKKPNTTRDIMKACLQVCRSCR